MAMTRKAKGGIAAGVATVVLVSGGLIARNITEDNTKTIDGELVVSHGDDFFNGTPTQVQAEVRTEDKTYVVEVPADQHVAYTELSGDQVEVQGTGGTGNFKPKKIKHSNKPPKGPAKLIPHDGTFRVAVIVMHPQGATTEPWPISKIQGDFFGQAQGWTAPGGSMADFYKKASNGALTITGQVFAYVDSTTPQDCNLTNVISVATGAAASKGYVPSNFDDIVVVTQGVTCRFGGQAWVGATGVQMASNINIGTAVHEVGHNLGVWHAGSLQCATNTGQSYADSGCLYSDYGDAWDIMGSTLRYFNAEHKWHMTWLDNASRVTAPTGASTFTLAPSEAKSVAGVTQEVVIPRGTPDNSFYTLEYRYSSATTQPYQSGDFDAGMPYGVYLHLIRFQGTSDTLALDATPAPGGDGNAWSLPMGQSDTIPVQGGTVTISVMSQGATAIVQVVRGAGPPPTTVKSTTTTTVRPTGTTTTTIQPGTPTVTATLQADRTVKVQWSQPLTTVKTTVQVSRSRTLNGKNIFFRASGAAITQGFVIDKTTATGTLYYTVRFVTSGTATPWSTPSIVTK